MLWNQININGHTEKNPVASKQSPTWTHTWRHTYTLESQKHLTKASAISNPIWFANSIWKGYTAASLNRNKDDNFIILRDVLAPNPAPTVQFISSAIKKNKKSWQHHGNLFISQFPSDIITFSLVKRKTKTKPVCQIFNAGNWTSETLRCLLSNTLRGETSDTRQDHPPCNWNQCQQAENPISDACQTHGLQSGWRADKFVQTLLSIWVKSSL